MRKIITLEKLEMCKVDKRRQTNAIAVCIRCNVFLFMEEEGKFGNRVLDIQIAHPPSSTST